MLQRCYKRTLIQLDRFNKKIWFRNHLFITMTNAEDDQPWALSILQWTFDGLLMEVIGVLQDTSGLHLQPWK